VPHDPVSLLRISRASPELAEQHYKSCQAPRCGNAHRFGAIALVSAPSLHHWSRLLGAMERSAANPTNLFPENWAFASAIIFALFVRSMMIFIGIEVTAARQGGLAIDIRLAEELRGKFMNYSNVLSSASRPTAEQPNGSTMWFC
jgi:hypothetical protein